MVQIAFIFLTVAGIAFFGWRTFNCHRTDPMTVAFGSLAVYFMPGLFGFAQFGSAGGDYFQPIVPGAYAVMGIVMLTIMLATVALDRAPVRAIPRLPSEGLLPATLLAILAVGAAISARTVGRFYFCDKDVVLQHLDQWYSYAAYAAPTCMVVSVVMRQRWITAIAVAAIVFDMVAGFRTEAAISFIALATIHVSMLTTKKGWATFVLIVAACGFGLFFVKQTIYTVKLATDPLCHSASVAAVPKPSASAMAGSLFAQTIAGKLVSKAIIQSEPFVIQATLNETVRQDFHTGAGYLLGQLLSGVPGGKLLFGINSSKVQTFNSMAQPALFPTVKDFGMANNPWAQAYAAGGYAMVLVFAIGYAGVVGALSWLFRSSTGAIQGFAAVVATWIAFYFQRNDLFVEIGILKFVVYIALGAVIASWVLGRLRNRVFGPATAPS